MWMMYLSLLITLILLSCASADIYLHNPRGSNNRLNEKTANRKNANRLFDSQNNNRGGYNVGDKSSSAFKTEAEQYYMKYFTSGGRNGGQSELTLEWTNQHGCGGSAENDPHKQNCMVVLQYMCGTGNALRNGQETDTQKLTKEDVKLGLHEPLAHYKRCSGRERNKGLFTADQNLRGNSAIYTRQNPDGNRRGYECPEERDYYPYWHPSPWIDLAILTDDVKKCNFYVKESFNTQSRGECVIGGKRGNKFNNHKDCEANKGEWIQFHQYLEKVPDASCDKDKTFVRAVPWDSETPTTKECLVPPPKMQCLSAPWTRSNHLGDTRGEGHAMQYTWRLPAFPSNENKRCVLRVRYNISTDDYDPWLTNSSSNGIVSPIQQEPAVQVNLDRLPLRLAINTNQLGRTFQDRSHVFELRPRPSEISAASRLFNLNVRGKRGNIVQVYPAVEYDFIPNRLNISENDLIHVQWTGSNTHRNLGASDGQAGDDGQGATGTDRHNWVEMTGPADNFPTPFESSRMLTNGVATIVWSALLDKAKAQDAAIQAASSGYFHCWNAVDCTTQSMESKLALNPLLNDAPASFPGFVFSLKKGKYYYMSTRNNNFSNRSQKGHIIVS